MNVLITGASGFLGSRLAHRWHGLGHDVGLLMRPTSSLARVRGLDHKVDIARCSDDSDTIAMVQRLRPDLVLHAACSYGRAGERHLDLFDTNVRLGMVILQALADLGRNTSFLNMGTALGPEVNAYALSKHQFVQWGRIFATQQATGMSFVNLRLQHMYGPGDDKTKFTSQVLHCCHANKPVLDLTVGDQVRDFVYIDDAVAALAAIADQRAKFGATADIEVGSGAAHTIREFAMAAQRLTHSTTRLNFGAIPYRASEVMHSVADVRALSALGWRPAFDLESGLRRYIALEFTPPLRPAGA